MPLLYAGIMCGLAQDFGFSTIELCGFQEAFLHFLLQSGSGELGDFLYYMSAGEIPNALLV